MGRSRLAWAGSAFAPWGIALAFLVSITAQAGQDPVWTGSPVAQEARADSPSPVREALLSSTFGLPARSTTLDGDESPILETRLILGAPEDLAVIPDEIEPNAAVKQGAADFPAIDRTRKGDPFIVLRPGFDAHRRRLAPPGEDGADDWPEDSRSPTAIPPGADAAASRPQRQFDDGATPGVPLELALNSSTPTPSDGKAIVVDARAPAQTTAAARFDADGKPNYAALIDPKDSARQMRCLAEAIYFESRGEPEQGQAAVAEVVLNRVRSGIFPTDVCAVVYQDRNHPFACQFSFACEGRSLRIEEPGPWATATRIAQEVVSGASYNPKVAEALNYHASYVLPFWAGYLRRVDRIGNHIFYAMRAGANWAPGALNGRGDLPPAPAAVQTAAATQASAAAR
ncbi:MAG: cell wall hydrolase [Roseiarcus sp.]|jgi:spore germination cell wall hydrolase CwlJ-like protein